MSGGDGKSEMWQAWKSKAEQLRRAEVGHEPVAVPEPQPSTEETAALVQLNLRVGQALRRRVRMLAARDDLSHSELIDLAIALYEDTHGRAE